MKMLFCFFLLLGAAAAQGQAKVQKSGPGTGMMDAIPGTDYLLTMPTGVGGSPVLATASNYLGNTTPITNQVECSTTSCGAGQYLVLVSVSPTSTATLGTLSLNLNFTDTAQAQTVTAISALALTLKVPATGVYTFWSTGAANITWSTTVSGLTGTYAYDVHVRLIKLF